jgi:hypothetical protein
MAVGSGKLEDVSHIHRHTVFSWQRRFNKAKFACAVARQIN